MEKIEDHLVTSKILVCLIMVRRSTVSEGINRDFMMSSGCFSFVGDI